MEYHEFIGKVQNIAGLPSEDRAVKVTRATLETLASRLAGNEPKNLADQLPREIGLFLDKSEEASKAERFTLDEFYDRVARLTGADAPDARHFARSVMAVLRTAVPKGEYDNIEAQLPNEYEPLLHPPEATLLRDNTKGER